MTSDPDTTRKPARGRRLLIKWSAIVLSSALLSLVLTTAVVKGEYRIGPGEVEISIRPQWGGSTIASIPPFGSVEASTHLAPVAVVLSPTSIDPISAQRLAESRPSQDELVTSLRADLEEALKAFALRLLAGGLLAGMLVAALARLRSVREALVAVVVGAALPVGLYAAAFASYDADAFRQPVLTGALSRSPELLGPVQQFGERFNALRTELDEIGSMTFQLYQFLARSSPIPNDAIRILHITDLHLNPVGFDVAQQVARRFNVAAVIDSGDLTAEGSPLEDGFTDRIPGFAVPYFFVRGNHDSADTEAAVAAHPNATVLDGTSADLEGLILFGVGDPLFTPDKTVEQPSTAEQRATKAQFASTVAEQLEALATPPHVVIVHDSLTATEVHGKVPLVLSGHYHRWISEEFDGTLVLAAGSTGGAGLKSLAPDSDAVMSLQVLYFDRESKTLLGYDRIDVKGPDQEFLLKRTLVEPSGEVEPADDAGESPETAPAETPDQPAEGPPQPEDPVAP